MNFKNVRIIIRCKFEFAYLLVHVYSYQFHEFFFLSMLIDSGFDTEKALRTLQNNEHVK